MLWHIGNTTVRTPYRLRSALIALQGSFLHGNLIGSENETLFAELLHNQGVVSIQRIENGKDYSDLGRKWRSALSQLGFITPKLSKKIDSGSIDLKLADSVLSIQELSGRPFEITPNGYRLINSEIITAQQECFLRSLMSYRIPSLLELSYKCQTFCPLKFVIDIFRRLEERKQHPSISFQEFALFVQTHSPDDELNHIVEEIISYRVQRQSSTPIRLFDRNQYLAAAIRVKRKSETLDDYADLSIRYLKATGLFKASGRGIAIVEPRSQFTELIRQEQRIDYDDESYLLHLWNGSALPTDDKESTFYIVTDLIQKLKDRRQTLDYKTEGLNQVDLQNIRLELEHKLLLLSEQDFADQQTNCIDEIVQWMEVIQSGKSVSVNGEKLSVPKGEAPAYLEWVIWRAFLAINSLCNPPWEARRFQIDQDFLPVHPAPGGGPDLIFEFKDSIVIVEVTLTSSSRQEAAEGEPVRRHVAKYVEDFEKNKGKDVFGLFIALKIDSNTAHTFRSGDWYMPDDTKLSLSIVPVTLEDFQRILLSGQRQLENMPSELKRLLLECRARANEDAPQWKKTISNIIQRFTRTM